jgi:hypothetical protein
VRASAVSGVFTFRVLADEHPVNSVFRRCCEGALGSWKGFYGAYVGEELEWTADGEEETPEGDMIGNIFLNQPLNARGSGQEH